MDYHLLLKPILVACLVPFLVAARRLPPTTQDYNSDMPQVELTSDERETTGGRAMISEYKTNYSSSLTRFAKSPQLFEISSDSSSPFADSLRLSAGNSSKDYGWSRTPPDGVNSLNTTKKKTQDHHHQVAHNQTTKISDTKTKTKRRDTWAASNQRRLIPMAPLFRLTLESPPLRSTTLPMSISYTNNKMQPKQDSGATISTQSSSSYQPNLNATTTGIHLPLPLPLGNYVNQQQQQQQQQVSAVPRTSADDRMSIVRSGFLVPSTFSSSASGASSGSPTTIHGLRALAPAAMALLAHAHHHDPSGPAKQLRALSQLRALMSLHQPTGSATLIRPPGAQQPAENLLPVRLLTPVSGNNLTGGAHASEQMLVATSNQLGVSHLAASSSEPPPPGGYQALASMQDYHHHQSPSQASDMRGPPGNGDQTRMRDPPASQRPPPGPGQDSRDEGDDNGGGRGAHPSDQDQPTRGGGGNGYGGPTSGDYPPSGQVGNTNGQQDGGYQAYGYDSVRGSSMNSSSGSGGGSGNNSDYYANPRAAPPGGGSPDHYGGSAASRHHKADMDVDGPVGALQNSLRSSLDTYEDYVGSPQSTSDFVQDLAELDDEFNRHAGMFGRPPVPSGRSTSQLNRDEYASSPSTMSDSMLAYSQPQRHPLTTTTTTTRYHHYHRPGGSLAAPGLVDTSDPSSSYGDYLSAAGSVANMIPRSYSGGGGGGGHQHHHHHHHDSTGGRHHQHHSPGGGGDYTMSAHDVPDNIWLTDSGTTSYDPSPLASYLSPSAQYSAGGGAAYASWPRPQHQQRYQTSSTAHSHTDPYWSHVPHPHAQHSSQVASHTRATPTYSPPYFTLATAPSSYALSTTASAASSSEQPQFSFIPAYAASSAAHHHVGTAAATPATETVSFTLSPLAAAAAAAATALAAADKTRHHHHHPHHAWTFTLPRLASTLAAQAVGPQLAAAATGATPTQLTTAGSNLHGTASALAAGPSLFHPQIYRPATAGPGGGGSYLFSPVPIYAIASRAPGVSHSAPLTGATSGTAATSILPTFHAFSPSSAGGPGSSTGATPTIIAYRPASMFSSAPLLTSFAYPFRLGPLSPLGSSYQPLSLAPALGASHHQPTALSGHHSKSSSHSGRGAGTGGSGGSSSSSSLKPFIADLQWAESGSKSKTNNNNNNNGQNGESTKSGGNSFVKTTAGGLTQMARNLTKKMFGSASQVRPQFVAPPTNFDSTLRGTLPAASSSTTVALPSSAASNSGSGISSSSPAAAATVPYSPSPSTGLVGQHQQSSSATATTS